MATADDMIVAIRAIADNRKIPGAVGLQTPGDKIDYKGSELKPGSAWGNDKSMQIMVEGIASYLDTLGLGEVGTIKTKLNELIGQYNQLRTDYLSEGLSTTASEVTPIP